jgi:hypothetical protein
VLGLFAEDNAGNEVRCGASVLIVAAAASVDCDCEIRDAEGILTLRIPDLGIPGQTTHKYDFIHDDLFFLLFRPLPVLRTDI